MADIRIQYGPDHLSDPVAPAMMDDIKGVLRRAQVPDAEHSLDEWAAAVIHMAQDDKVRDQWFQAINAGQAPRGLMAGYQFLESKVQAATESQQAQQAPVPVPTSQNQQQPAAPKIYQPTPAGQTARPPVPVPTQTAMGLQQIPLPPLPRPNVSGYA